VGDATAAATDSYHQQRQRHLQVSPTAPHYVLMEDIDYESLPTNAGLAVRWNTYYISFHSMANFRNTGQHVGWCTRKIFFCYQQIRL